MKKLVRDNIPKLDKTGKFKYRPAEFAEIHGLLRAKLQEEVSEFLSKPCLDEYVDVCDVLAQIAVYYQLIGTEKQFLMVMDYSRVKQERNGMFREYWVQEEVIPEPPEAPGATADPEGGLSLVGPPIYPWKEDNVVIDIGFDDPRRPMPKIVEP